MSPPIQPFESEEDECFEEVELGAYIDDNIDDNVDDNQEISEKKQKEEQNQKQPQPRSISSPLCVVGLLLLLVAILAVIITVSVKYAKCNNDGSSKSATTADIDTAPSQSLLNDCSWEKIIPFDASEKKKFGAILAVDGNTLAVGAQGDTVNGADSGSVYIYEKDETSGRWLYDTKLVPSDGQPGDTAAYVDISGKFVAVGAKKHDHYGEDSGALYIFMKKDNGAWIEDAKIIPPDGEEGDMFGNQLAIDGKTLLIGARRHDDGKGAVYAFRRTKGRWKQYGEKLIASENIDDEFGGRINFSGSTAVITKNGPDGYWSDKGSAYVYTDTEDGFQEVQHLLPEDEILFDTFGTKVDINEDEDTIVIGAYKTDRDGKYEGSAYIFTLGSDGVWSQATKLELESEEVDYQFGRDVAIRGNTILVLAESAYEEGNTGAVFVFTGSGSEWKQQVKLVPATSDPLSTDGFGSSLAIEDDHNLIIGSRYDSESGFKQSGSAYIIELC